MIAEQFNKNALPVLLDLFETPNKTIAGVRLYERYPAIAEKFILDEWIRPIDTVLSIDVDDELRPVVWRSDADEYQYLCSNLGWVTVSPDLLKQYKVNFKKCVPWFLHLFKICKSSNPIMLFEDALAFLGVTTLDSRRVNIYLCSQLDDIRIRTAIVDILQQEAVRGDAIVICGRQSLQPLELPEHMPSISFETLLCRHDKYCSIDYKLMESLLYSNMQREIFHVGLHFSEDYRLVRWGGEQYKLTKNQAAVVEALHEAGGRAHKDLLIAKSNSNSKSLHQIMRNMKKGKMVPHSLWGTLIVGSGDGYYYFNENK